MNALLPGVLAAAGAAVSLLPTAPRRLAGLTGGSAAARPRPSLDELGRLPWLPPLVGAAVAGLLLGVAAALVGGLLAWLTTRVLAVRTAARHLEAERDGLAEALGALADELRAGRPPGAALEAVVEAAGRDVGAVLRAAASTHRTGGDAALVLESARGACEQDLHRLGVCWRVCGGSGSGLAASVAALHAGVAAARARQQLVEAELAGPRATALLLAGLPVAGLLLAAGLGAHPLHVLLHTTVGLVCLAAGLALDLLGLWWTGRIVAGAAGP